MRRGADVDVDLVMAVGTSSLPVAGTVATQLELGLSCLCVHRLSTGLPDVPALTFGAVCEGDDVVVDASLAAAVDVGERVLARMVRHALARVARSSAQLAARAGTPPDLRGRDVILVSDGRYEPWAALAAARAARAGGAARVDLALPLLEEEVVELLGTVFARIFCVAHIDGTAPRRDTYASDEIPDETSAVSLLRGVGQHMPRQ